MSRRETLTAEMQLALACVTVAAGCLLLGMQVDGTGALVGTGRTALAIGVVVALVAMLLRSAREARLAHKRGGGPWLPRDLVSVAGVVVGFFGLACVVGGVLAPGGGWMFFEVLLIVSLLAFHQSRGHHFAPLVGPGAITMLSLMLIFRLWITWQGSEHRWAVMSIDVPILSGLPLSFLDPIRTVSLGSFSPAELGFPPTGIDFHVSMTLWALGFVLCIDGAADVGNAELLAAYRSWRGSDQRKLASFTHALVRGFGNELPGVRGARSLGLLAFDLIPGAKSQLARHTMGLAGRVPKLARGLGFS
jgi:hypothetical protein